VACAISSDVPSLSTMWPEMAQVMYQVVCAVPSCVVMYTYT